MRNHSFLVVDTEARFHHDFSLRSANSELLRTPLFALHRLSSLRM